MKIFSILLVATLFAIISVEACVTYDKSKGTYTVDPSGCVQVPERE